jgi:hypothetical protein
MGLGTGIALHAVSLIGPALALADTGPTPPPGPDPTSTTSLLPIVALAPIVVGAIVFARFPRTRAWIAAAVVLLATAIGAFAVVVIGTIGGWSGRPMEPWTIPALVAVIVAGLAAAAVTVLRFPGRGRT